MRRLLAMTPADYAEKTTVDGDDLDTVISFSTHEGFQEKRGLLGIVWSDVFLRAFADKQSDERAFQVYAQIVTQGSEWPRIRSANYETPDGPKRVDVDNIHSDVSCSGGSYGGCTYYETVTFTIDREFLELIGSSYEPGGRNAWRMRFNSQTGQDVDLFVMPAEAAGLLQKVDETLAQR